MKLFILIWWTLIIISPQLSYSKSFQKPPPLNNSHKIFKRYVLHRTQWNRCFLTWAFRDPFHLFSTEHEFLSAKKIVTNAIRIWQHESGNILRFLDISPTINWHNLAGSLSKIPNGRVAHIDILFAKFDHGDGEKFDGRGGLVAHSAYPPNGIVHFDASEKWSLGEKLDDGKKEWDTKIHKQEKEDISSSSNNLDDEYVNLPYVALHELGHAIGIRHSSFNKSVMNPYYSQRAKGIPHLSRDDIAAVRELYESCSQIASVEKFH